MAAVNDFRRVCAEDHNFLLQQCYKPNRPPAQTTSSSISPSSTGASYNTHQQQHQPQQPNISTTPNMQGNPGNALSTHHDNVLTKLLQQQQQQQ